MNFVIITALLSAGNSGLFSCARMLFSLAEEGHAPKSFMRLTRRGIPIVALSVSMALGLVSLLSSVIAASTVYLALVSIAGFAVVAVWMSIVASQFFHRRAFLRNGGDLSTLPYRTPLFPLVPVLAFVLLLVSVIAIAFDPNQVAALYFGIPFVGLCYLFFWWRYGRRGARPSGRVLGRGSCRPRRGSGRRGADRRSRTMTAPSSLSQGLALVGSAVARERSGRPGHTASRLADDTGIERSRVSRLTQELRALRFLQRDEDAAFGAGDAYFRTAAALDAPWLRTTRQELRALASTLRMTAVVSAADGPAALTLRAEAGGGATDAATRYGTVTPIWCTGAGRALLWDHSLDRLRELLQDVQFVGVGGPAAARTVEQVHALLERDRAAGAITAVDEYTEGVVEFALPIRGATGVVASIAVSGAPRGAGRTRAALSALHEVQRRLSARASGQ